MLIGLSVIFFLCLTHLSLFFPLPIVYFFLRGGRGLGYMSAFCALIGILALSIVPETMNDQSTKIFDITYLFLGVSCLIGEVTLKTKHFLAIIYYTIALLILSSGLLSLSVFFFDSNSMDVMVTDYLDDVMKQGKLLENEQQLDQLKTTIVRLIPGLGFMNIIMFVWLNLLILIKRFPGLFDPFDPTGWSVPEWGIGGLVGVLGLVCLGFFIDNPLLDRVAMNGLLIVGTIYFFQGLSIVAYYMKKLPSITLIRPLLYFLIILNLSMVVAVLGVFDFWFDFRQLKKKISEG